MTCRRGLGTLISILIIAGVLGGCDGGESDAGAPLNGTCLLFGEREPNATALTAQFLDNMFFGDCFIVEGDVFDLSDVDSYRVFIQETLTLVVTLDHSPLVDFDVQIFDADTGQLILDCGVNVLPEVCVVPFVVRSLDIAVDIVVTSFSGAGTYTLTLDTQ